MRLWRRLVEFILNPRISYRAWLSADRGEEISKGLQQGENLAAPLGARQVGRLRSIVLNLPLVGGSLIVLALFLVVLFGPLWAPSNPYISGQHIGPHYDQVSKEWVHPPIPPSADYPLGTDEWGNDILSMLLYGARNTLIASAFITMVRILLGTVFGSLAGWNEGRTLDQLIMGLIGVITAIPMLISSMILIFALDIRRGLPVFIIALAVIGWTEIAQYIRSEFIVIRRQPYIEGARAVGARSYAVAVRHVLPNILPQLLVITFLEIGAVLMLLGELGFVGVYIGGGSRIAMGDEITGIEIVKLVEIPEWGAMLAAGYRWLRARPHVVFPPALAFFISVLGFNALGEGLRRLIEVRHVNTGFLLRKRMLLIAAVLSAATVFIINNTGPAPWFVRLAQAFEGSTAYDHTRLLSEIPSRAAGEAGGERAALYLAEAFAGSGMQPGWRHSEYIYPLETTIVRPRSQPIFELLDKSGASIQTFQHQLDYGYQIYGHAGSGAAEAPLYFLGFEHPAEDLSWENYKGLDLTGHVLLVIAGNAPVSIVSEALIRGAEGIVWVTDSGRDAVRSESQLVLADEPYLSPPTLPVIRIRPEAADKILDQASIDLDQLLDQGKAADVLGPGWYGRKIQTRVRIEIDLLAPEVVEIPCVLGYLPGSDYELANELVVLAVGYDSLPDEVDGRRYEGANHNAAGVGILLEVARLWQEQQLEPRRSVLFIAWGASQLDHPGLQEFLSDRNNLRHLPSPRATPPLRPHYILQWDYSGAGGEALYLHPNTGKVLSEALQATANDLGLRLGSDPGQAAPFDDLVRIQSAASAYLAWQPPQVSMFRDDFDTIKADQLETFGRMLTLTLTRIVRQDQF